MDTRSPSITQLSTCLLELHERAHELDFRDMQRFVFARAKATIAFDAALIAQGTVTGGVPVVHDVLLDGRTEELMASWENVKEEDVIAQLAIARPGTTVNVSLDEPLFDPVPNLRAHCRAHGIAHALCTAIVSPLSGLFWVLSLYRDGEARFTEHERVSTEAMAPHILASLRKSRLGQLRRSAQLSDDHGQFAAIATRNGVVLEAEPGFGELVASQFRGWNGPNLPVELRIGAGSTRSTHRFERMVATLATSDDVVLVHVRRPLPADRLTEREREIASAFSSGETHREIGGRLGIAPNTVRRHLANIYEKLGISSKVELDRMISGIS